MSELNNSSLSEENWPAWLLEKYGSLPLPSLYDFIVSQEKLAAEIRKQNKELRLLSQESAQIIEKMNQIEQAISIEESDDSTEWQEKDQEQTVQILMDAFDALWNLFKAQQEMGQTILSILPKKKKFWSFKSPAWRLQLEQILQGYSNGIKTLQEKLISSLEALDITVIIPELGAPFQPHLHKIVESKEKINAITKIIRCGYLKQGEVLRYAEVSIS